MRRNLYTQTILSLSCEIFMAAFLVLFANGCSKEHAPSPSSPEDYSLEQARALYLQNRTTITLPEWAFQNTLSTKSPDPQSVLIPNWKGTKTIKLPERNLIRHEIPLNIPFPFTAFLSRRERVEISHTLVIEFETKTNTSRQFIATIIGKQAYQAATYSSKKDKFRGFVLFSELNGKFITGFHYSKGTRTAIKLYDPNGTCPVLTSFWIGNSPLQTKIPQEPTKNKYCRECVSMQPFIGEVCQSCGLWSMGLQEIVVSVERPDEGGSNCRKCFRNPCECNNPNAPFGCPICLYLYCSGGCEDTGGGGGGDGKPAEGEWWPGGHRLLFEKALTKYMSPENLETVIDGSRYADNGPDHQKTYNAYRHAMRAPNQSRTEAIGKMKEHFNEHVMAFIANENYHSLGQALHMVQDAYSPLHNFEIWDGSTLSLMEHVFTESIHFHQEPALAAIDATDRLYGEIYNIWKRWRLSHEIGEDEIPGLVEF